MSLPSLWEALGKPALKESKVKLLEEIPTLDGYFTLEFINFIATQHQFKKLNSGNIYNTRKSIEGCYVDLLEGLEIYGGKGWFSTSFLYLMKGLVASSLFLKRYTHVYLE